MGQRQKTDPLGSRPSIGGGEGLINRYGREDVRPPTQAADSPDQKVRTKPEGRTAAGENSLRKALAGSQWACARLTQGLQWAYARLRPAEEAVGQWRLLSDRHTAGADNVPAEPGGSSAELTTGEIDIAGTDNAPDEPGSSSGELTVDEIDSGGQVHLTSRGSRYRRHLVSRGSRYRRGAHSVGTHDRARLRPAPDTQTATPTTTAAAQATSTSSAAPPASASAIAPARFISGASSPCSTCCTPARAEAPDATSFASASRLPAPLAHRVGWMCGTYATGQPQSVVGGAPIAYPLLRKEDAAQAVVAARARRGPARSRDASPNHEPACRTMLVSRVVSRNV